MSWGRYESMKADWLARHPEATPAEIAKAMRLIARRLKL